MHERELAGFLRSRREALRPEDAGLTAHGRSRRTPGLRREEVAWLAGVSTSYYERLEQARAAHPSAQVLTALGTALRLSAAERAHLAGLAGHAPPAPRAPATEVPDGVLAMLAGLGHVPAYVLNPALDVLAWNDLAAALIADFGGLPAVERNLVRLSIRYGGSWCTAPPGQEDQFGRQVAAELRSASARYPAAGIGGLADEFAAHSPSFAAGWSGHDVRERPVLRKRLRHAEVGPVDLDCQTLLVPGHDLRVVLCTAEDGSLSAAKLARLRRRVAVENAATAPTSPVSGAHPGRHLRRAAP